MKTYLLGKISNNVTLHKLSMYIYTEYQGCYVFHYQCTVIQYRQEQRNGASYERKGNKMTKIIYRINKNDLTKEEQEKVSHYYKGLKASRDTMTEIFEGGDTKYEETYYIFIGNHTPYGACVKHGDRYVFARYSRYDSIAEDFTDYARDCDETGKDDRVFTTKHFTMTDNTVEY